MAHPVIDDSKTWTYLLEHKPPALRGFINNHPQQFELEREVRKFTDRTTGAVSGSIGNTDDQMDMYGESCLGGCFT